MKRGAKATAEAAREDRQALIGIRRLGRELRESIPRIAPPVHKSPAIVVHQGGGQFALSLQRLEELEDVLRGSEPLDTDMREEILAILALVARDAEARASKRTGTRDRELFMLASTVAVLRETHKVPLKAAMLAVLPRTLEGDELRKRLQNLEKAYRALRNKGNAGMRIIASQSRVDRALAWLVKPEMRK